MDDNKNNTKETVEITSADDVKEIVVDETAEAVDTVVLFSKKYKFEGKTIESVDLSGLADLSAEDGQDIERLYKKITKTYSTSPETTVDYAMAAASKITGLPVEFFKQVSLKDAVKIKNRVINFLYTE